MHAVDTQPCSFQWNSTGTTFRIILEGLLQNGVNVDQFLLTLAQWGFKRVEAAQEKDFPTSSFVFQHPLFRRGQVRLLDFLTNSQQSGPSASPAAGGTPQVTKGSAQQLTEHIALLSQFIAEERVLLMQRISAHGPASGHVNSCLASLLTQHHGNAAPSVDLGLLTQLKGLQTPVAPVSQNDSATGNRHAEPKPNALFLAQQEIGTNKRGGKPGTRDATTDPRIRPFQEDQWSQRLSDLRDYHKRFGNCLVPHNYQENRQLARWVKRQRYQYKLMMKGRATTMTQERKLILEDLGFVWDSQCESWEERLSELKAFRKSYGHCNVPSGFKSNEQLARWVKCQRRQYKLFQESKNSNMTEDRLKRLEAIGFEWLVRGPYKKAPRRPSTL